MFGHAKGAGSGEEADNGHPPVALPTTVVSALALVRMASNWMSALFLTATVLTFVSIPFSLIYLSTHHASSRLLRTVSPVVTTLAALLTTAATVIATAMFVIFRNVFANASVNLNIDAQLGAKMFALMWVAVGLEILGMVLQWGLCCYSCCRCCGGRRSGGEKRSSDLDGEGAREEKVLRKEKWRRRRIQSEGEKL